MRDFVTQLTVELAGLFKQACQDTWWLVTHGYRYALQLVMAVRRWSPDWLLLRDCFVVLVWFLIFVLMMR